GGVGMEGAGATLGLATVDLVAIVEGLAVVGHEVEVNGQGLATATQGLGQSALEGTVDTALEFVGLGQRGEESVVDGGIGRSAAKGLAGGSEGGHTAGSVAQHRPEHAGGTLGTVVLQPQVALAKQLRVSTDSSGGQGIMALAHGFLPW